MNLDHDFFQVSKLSEDQKNGTLFSPNSGEDQNKKKGLYQKWSTFFPLMQVETCTQMHARVNLLEGMQMKTILKLWGDTVKLLGGYIPPGLGTPADTYAMAIGLLNIVKSKLFRFCCISMKKRLGILKPLDQLLQGRETHFEEAMDLVDTTLKLVSATRTDSHFTSICESDESLLPNPDHQSNVSEAPSASAESKSRPKRRRLVNSFLADYVVLGNVSSETKEEQSTTLFDDASAKRIYFHAIDSITNELTCRFKHNAWLYNAVYAMCRKSKSFLDR